MNILYILLAILMLGVLVMIHEFGHFAAARLLGIEVKEFSIGFGKKLWGRLSRRGTQFSLRLVPLGGYCMFYGDTDDDPEGKTRDDPRNYTQKPAWKRVLVTFAGPLMNAVLALVLAIVLMGFYGVESDTPFLVEVQEGSPAYEAGLRPGDLFVRIGDTDLTAASAQTVSNAIGAYGNGQAIPFTMLREGQEVAFSVVPAYNEELQRYMVGITIQQGQKKLAPGRVLPAAWELTAQNAVAIVQALGKMVTTGEGLDQSAGPVGIVNLVAQETRTGGLPVYLQLAVFISINLGLMNLLPIPGLDGCRIIFLVIEMIRRKPVDQKIEAIVHLCGYALLLGLMIFFTVQDVRNLFVK
ncbi:MAG: site-2 protease family protein [Clostridiales bacterium]|nr:site-2 protease family protein [Clostridiales bacterium]